VELALKDRFTEYFDVPVVIKNDMNAAVLGEYTLGNGVGYNNVVYVSCGNGLGAGLIIDGKLYEGRDHAAGEISFITDKELMRDSKTIEDRLSTRSILAKISDDIQEKKEVSPELLSIVKKKGRIEFEDLVHLANQQDEYVINLIKETGEDLGIVLVGITTLLNVEKIILGGELLAFIDILKVPISKMLERFTPFPPKFVPSVLGNKMILAGGFIFGREILLQGVRYTPTPIH
jgi:predicted NBD/HSP70 family sugar kinase